MAGTGRFLLRLLLGAGLLAPLLSMTGSAAGDPAIRRGDSAASVDPTILDPTILDPTILETQLLQLLNGERARSGLPAVGEDGSMNAMARSHSQAMAAADRIFHDPAKLGLLGRCVVVGENVGRAITTDIVHQAFMASPIHRSDILGPYDRAGVGVAAGPGGIYVTELFCQSRPAPVQPTTPPAPQPSPAPVHPAPHPAKPAPVPVKPAPSPATPAPSPATPAPSPSASVPAPLGKPAGMGTPCRLI